MSWRGSGWCWVLFVLAGILFASVAQGNPGRRWSVRKTGQFGRRIDPTTNPTEDLHTTKQFRLHEPSLDVAESRHGFYGGVVRKPSQSLELPRLQPAGNNSPVSGDQEAQETGDSEGYAYANPDGGEQPGGYDYPSPVAKNPPEEPEAVHDAPPQPVPQEPDFAPGPGDAVFAPLPLNQEEIDSQALRPNRPKPSSPQVAAVASHSDSSACHDDNDPNCWPHGYAGAIPGEAGTDYPILSEIVPTGFSCDDQDFSGYYADTDEAARCQIFHICLKGNRHRRTRQWSFLCPNGTIYSQSDFVCVWWADAPDCNTATVRSLYSLNEQLGWDNVTEGDNGARRGGGGGIGGRNTNVELQSAMSAVSSRNSALRANNKPSAVPTTFRPASFSTANKGSRTALPYRVPVKVQNGGTRARTKLQEVTQNALHGSGAHELDYGDETEHEVEESSKFETSLRQQSESRHKSKTASALHKSTSEAYELKGSPDGIQPFVVSRPRAEGHHREGEIPPHGDFNDDGQHHVVMMPSLRISPDGTQDYAQVPVMLPHGTTEEAFEGYRYPVPTTERNATPAPTYLPPFQGYEQPSSGVSTTTENFQTPTIPTEPPLGDTHENYEIETSTTSTEPPSTTEQSGYQYPIPTTTEQSGGYRYTDQTTTTTDDGGYRYPTPTTTEQSAGYKYTEPTSTQQTTDTAEGYVYTNPTTEQTGGYVYTNPTTTEQTTSSDGGSSGYQYPTPEASQQLRETGYNYPTPTTTQAATVTTDVTDIQTEYQVTGNEVEDYREATRETPKPQYGLPQESTGTTPTRGDLVGSTLEQQVVSTTTTPPVTTDTTESTPAGTYLPPKSNVLVVLPRGSEKLVGTTPASSDARQEGDDDTVDIAGGGGEGDYEDEENEVTDTTGAEEAGGYGGYSVTPPSGNSPSPIELPGGNLGTSSQLYITNLREELAQRQKQRGNPDYNNGNTDSDEKLNEILRQIQSGGIEAVDASGKPIAFNQLKDLLLNSPRGSVELKGEGLDSVTSSSTEIPKKTSAPPARGQQEEPYYHTVTTASVSTNNNNNQYFTNQELNIQSPSGFYLPPQNNNNNNNNQQQQFLSLATNNAQVAKPAYEVRLPTREFESHFVDSNAIESNKNGYSSTSSSSQQIQYQQQSQVQVSTVGSSSSRGYEAQIASLQPPQQVQYPTSEVNVPYSTQTQASSQQQFFPQASYQGGGSGGLQPPTGQYLPPRQDYEQSVLSNLVQPQQQQQQQQSVQFESPAPPEKQYLPPRTAQSSILQPQYYNPESKSSAPLVSQQIQLTENIQLQQSFAQPLPPSGPTARRNPLNPKDIKIVPALFVHGHTSVASQNDPTNIRHNTFQSLESAQSTNQLTTSSRFGTRNSIAEQLNLIASNSYLPQQSLGGRQFSRRSNGAGGRSSSSSAPSSSSSIQKLPRVSTFTLEDARSTEELQQYHHQDLKRFHSENIAKAGVLLNDTPRSSPEEPSRNADESRHVPSSSNSNTSSSRRGSSSPSKSSRSSNNSPSSRYSISTSIIDSNASHSSRDGKPGEDFFIPVSGSFTGSSSRSSNSGGGGGKRSGSRGFLLDSESESTLLSRFLPEEEGGFGAKL